MALLTRGALRRLLGRFVRSRSGNVAVIFALASLPVIAAMGVAVDYTRLSQVTGDVQDALDATALALSRQTNVSTMTSSQIQTFAKNYFAANFNNSDLQNLVLTAAYSATGPAIKITATGNMLTDFMGIVGTPNIPINRTSNTIWGEARLRVALVLDTTGSMSSSNKITALKTATNNLLTQLKGAATTDGDVYVSIVPFVRDINVGSSNYAASWIDWTDWLAEPQVLDPSKCWGSTCGAKPANWAKYGTAAQGGITSCPFPSSWNNYTYGFGCASSATSTSLVTTIPSTGYICPAGPTNRADTAAMLDTMNGVAYNGCYTSVLTSASSTGSSAACPARSSTNGTYLDGYNGTTNTCSCTGKNSNKKCTWSYISHVWRGDTASAPKYNTSPTTWNGCIADRGIWSGPSNSNYDQNVTTPTTATTATLFPAQQYTSCPSAITPLTYDWTALGNAVTALSPNGSTNQAIGLAHGWQSLVGGGPYPAPPVEDAGHVYKHVIILLTDGLNTQDRWYGDGYNTSTQVNDRQSPLCDNIKAAGITLYTVQVNTGNDATSTLLQNCASSSDKFFLLTTADQIVTTFQQIGTELSDLRISK